MLTHKQDHHPPPDITMTEDGATQQQDVAPTSKVRQPSAANMSFFHSDPVPQSVCESVPPSAVSRQAAQAKEVDDQIKASAAGLTKLQVELARKVSEGPAFCSKCEHAAATLLPKGRVGTITKRTQLCNIGMICQCGGSTVLSTILALNASREGPRQAAFQEMERQFLALRATHDELVSGLFKTLEKPTKAKANVASSSKSNKAITDFFGRVTTNEPSELALAKAATLEQAAKNAELKAIIEDLQQQLRSQTSVIGEMSTSLKELRAEMATRQTEKSPAYETNRYVGSSNSSGERSWTTVARTKAKTAKTAQPTRQPAANVVGPTRTPTGKPSFAEAAKKGKAKPKSPKAVAKAWGKQIAKAFEPSTEPIEFVKIQFVVPNTKSIKQLKPYARREWVQRALKFLGVRKETFEHSLIGCSIVEIYVPAEEASAVKAKLADRGVELVTNGKLCPENHKQSPEKIEKAIISRLATLLNRAKLVRLKACILRDFPENVKQAALKKAADWVKSLQPAAPIDPATQGEPSAPVATSQPQRSWTTEMDLDDQRNDEAPGAPSSKKVRTNTSEPACSSHGAELL